MRKVASTRAGDLATLRRVARYKIKHPRMACKFLLSKLDSTIDVFGDANLAGCISMKKFKGCKGRAVKRSIFESMVQNDGILALR